MEKMNDLIQYFINNHIVTNKNGKLRVISMYRHSSDVSDDAIKKVDDFISEYRSEKEAWYCLKNHITEIPKCPICGMSVKFDGRKYNLTCENHSANQLDDKKKASSMTYKSKSKDELISIRNKAKKTCLERYGDENYSLYGSESFKKKLKEKYGDEHYSNHDKAVQTCLERYGVKCNLILNSEGRSKRIWDERHDEITAKIRKTSMEKYGEEYYVKTKEFKQKSKDTQIKNFGSIEAAYEHRVNKGKVTKETKYGNPSYRNIDKYRQTILENHIEFENENNCTHVTTLVNKYGQGWLSLNLPYIRNGRYIYLDNKYIPKIEQYNKDIHNYKATSFQEEELFTFIKSHTSCEVLRNKKDIIRDEDGHKLEIDIYIPDLKIGIEYNGDYWHSSYNKDKYYHQIKTKLCYENGIQLIHIYGKDWIYNRKEIERRLIQLLSGNDCTKYNWILIQKYDEYDLTEPEIVYINDNRSHDDPMNIIYNEGKFTKKEYK